MDIISDQAKFNAVLLSPIINKSNPPQMGSAVALKSDGLKIITQWKVTNVFNTYTLQKIERDYSEGYYYLPTDLIEFKYSLDAMALDTPKKGLNF